MGSIDPVFLCAMTHQRLFPSFPLPPFGHFAPAGKIPKVLSYVAAGAYEGDGFTIIDVKDPLSPTIVGWLDGTIDGAQHMLYVSESLVLGLGYLNHRLYTIDVSDPAAPTILGSITSAQLSNPIEVRVKDNYAYVVSRGLPGLVKVDISDPTSPVQVAYVSLPYPAGQPAFCGELVGDYAYVGNRGSPKKKGSFLNIVRLADMVNVATVDPFAAGIAGFWYDGERYVYCTPGADRLGVLDAIDPTAPTVVADYVIPGISAPHWRPHLRGSYIYVTGRESDSFHIIDVSDPASPVQVGSLTAVELDGAWGILGLNDKYAFVVAAWADRLVVIDITDKTSPALVTSLYAVPQLDCCTRGHELWLAG